MKNKKKYNKPHVTVHGNLIDLTKAGETGTGDFAGKHRDS